MRSRNLRLPAALLPALLSFAPPAALAAQGTAAAPLPRVLLVSIDGLAPASYLDPDAAGLAVPNLRALAAQGAFASGVSGVLPTSTYPSHTTLITGVPPRVHGILGNRIFDPTGRSNEAWHWYASEIRVPTLATAAYREGMITGAISWPVTVGLEVDALVPEIWRSGSTAPEDGRLIEALSSTALFSEVAERRGAPLVYPLSDRDRGDLALHVLETRKPQLLLVHFIDHDLDQHHSGLGSPEAKAALEAADAELGRLRAKLDELGLAGETLVVVVSDHGFQPADRELHPNALLRQAGLIETDAAGKVTRWTAAFDPHGGTAFLRLADPADQATLDRVRRIVEVEAAKKGSGIRAILGAPEIEALGGDPEVTPLALDAREGFYFEIGSAAWNTPAKDRAAHGYAPVRPGLEAALVVAGRGLTRKGDLGTVPMTRIAPTLARYLGVQLAPQAAEPLDWLTPPR